MTTDLIENVKDGVAVLTLNRPDRLNAMSRPMLDALLEALPRLAEDPAVAWWCSPAPGAASARAAT
jgi:2-(1,2-epoxy-1,2-dihydrophenyl)acetyl-CoA isomerase